jgi:hypothetical protein
MFVEGVADLLVSVRHFMEAPEHWREAVGTRPKFFVHYRFFPDTYDPDQVRIISLNTILDSG